MPERRVHHLVYTNAAGRGEAGHRVVTWPQEWDQQQVTGVARWLATLRMLPGVKVFAGYAARRFSIAQSSFFCLARLQPDFSLDQRSREGSVLLHAMFVGADPSDRGAMHLVALTKAAREIFDLGGISSLPPEQRLQSYLKKCDGLARVDIPAATIETFDELGLETIRQFLLALSASDPQHVASFREPSDYTLPQRLATATGALPPRLRLSIGWGTWIHPAEGLNFVARIGGELGPRVKWKKFLEDYFGWLQRTLKKKRRGELKQVLDDWSINDWEQLGRLESPEIPSPAVASGQPSPPPTSSAALASQVTPEFLHRQIAQITESLNQTFEKKFVQLEERLREDIRKELGASRGSPVPAAESASPADVSMVELSGGPGGPKAGAPEARPLWAKIIRGFAVLAALGALALLIVYATVYVTDLPRPSEEEEAEAAAVGVKEEETPAAGPVDWVGEWEDYLRSNPRVLAAVSTRIADAQNLTVSDEQKNQFRLIAEALEGDGVLTSTEIDNLRHGVFEYCMTVYEIESDQPRNIRIDLVLSEIPLPLVEKAVAEFEISLTSLGIDVLDEAALEDPKLQAAIVLSWLRKENESLSAPAPP